MSVVNELRYHCKKMKLVKVSSCIRMFLSIFDPCKPTPLLVERVEDANAHYLVYSATPPKARELSDHFCQGQRFAYQFGCQFKGENACVDEQMIQVRLVPI